MAQWLDGRVVERIDWNDALHTLKIAADIAPFQAGQFIKLALEIDGELVGRPYSLVNSPAEKTLEFFFNVVQGAPLSPRLAALQAGDAIKVAPQANGFLVLEEVPESDTLWLISTGSGIGPFLSILDTPAAWARHKKIVLIQAVRHQIDLAYKDRIAQVAARHPDQFVHVAFVSREAVPGTLSGRIPDAIRDGRLEAQAGATLSATTSHIMLCGNPGMIAETTEALVARGMKKHRRKDPGQISVESYW